MADCCTPATFNLRLLSHGMPLLGGGVYGRASRSDISLCNTGPQIFYLKHLRLMTTEDLDAITRFLKSGLAKRRHCFKLKLLVWWRKITTRYPLKNLNPTSFWRDDKLRRQEMPGRVSRLEESRCRAAISLPKSTGTCSFPTASFTLKKIDSHFPFSGYHKFLCSFCGSAPLGHYPLPELLDLLISVSLLHSIYACI